jgi:tyrosyl-tRNA synthetase
MSSIQRIVNVFQERKILQDISSTLLGQKLYELISTKKNVSVYAGFDPTAPSLHLGHLAVIISLSRLQKFGLKPIVLIGGATALIGDPTGKSSDRPFLSEKQVENNIKGIQNSLSTLIDFDKCDLNEQNTSAICINNASFYQTTNVIHFMRTIGTRFRLSYMLNKDSIKNRLQPNEDGTPSNGMSFTEFSYQLFQANDFLELHRSKNCYLQIGGSDQWGNITAGIELVRRTVDSEVYGMTVPLVTTHGGKKFGKSEGNALWLDPKLTSHHDLYQYLYNLADEDCAKLLSLLTYLEIDYINEVTHQHFQNPDAKLAQKVLASEVTRIVRGEDGLKAALKSAEVLFGHSGNRPYSFDDLELLVQTGDVTTKLMAKEAISEKSIVDLSVNIGLVSSKTESRRLIQMNGLYLNKLPVQDIGRKIQSDDFIGGKYVVIGSGKKKQTIIKVA